MTSGTVGAHRLHPRARWRVSLALLVLAGALTPSFAAGQGSSGNIKIRLEGDLDWGQVIGGIRDEIRPSETRAARLSLQGEREREIFVRFLLPSELVGPGGATLPLSFSEVSGLVSKETNDPASGIPFDPRTTLNTVTPDLNSGKMWLWLGGILEVPLTARGGTYQDYITIEVGFTGN